MAKSYSQNHKDITGMTQLRKKCPGLLGVKSMDKIKAPYESRKGQEIVCPYFTAKHLIKQTFQFPLYLFQW